MHILLNQTHVFFLSRSQKSVPKERFIEEHVELGLLTIYGYTSGVWWLVPQNHKYH